MYRNFFEKAYELHQHRIPFVIASVVHRIEPSSGKPGDKAIITPEGNIFGWVGGGCTRAIVLKEAMEALKDEHPRVVRISPEESSRQANGKKDYKMSCYSGGTVEVYIEPIIPRPHLLVMGNSTVAKALAKIGKAMDYNLSIMAEDIDPQAFPEADQVIESFDLDAEIFNDLRFIIVATQGVGDEQALEAALKSKADYISFVASAKKSEAVFRTLSEKGYQSDQLIKIHTPAGLDIKAKLPEEIAISILAEVIRTRRSKEPDLKPAPLPSVDKNDFFINPVCQVPVQISTAKYVLEYRNESYYFCCDGCKVAFEKEPEKYAAKS